MLAVRATSLLFALSTLAIVMGTPVRLAGQDSATGSIRGTVVDPAGARVTQASVVVVNAGTSTQYTATSDSEGHFALELLPPGDYSTRAEAEGMSPQVSPPVHVDVGGVTELVFRLKIAGAQESLTVSSAPAMVETKPSAVSTLLDERSMNDFPLNGRRFFRPCPVLTRCHAGSSRPDFGYEWRPYPSAVFAGYTTPSSSMAVITTTPSSRRRAVATGRHISFPPRSCRSFAWLAFGDRIMSSLIRPALSPTIPSAIMARNTSRLKPRTSR